MTKTSCTPALAIGLALLASSTPFGFVTPVLPQSRTAGEIVGTLERTPQATVDRILNELRRAQLPDLYAGAGWEQGPDPANMARLRARWTDGYDWRAAEARLNRFPGYRVSIGGVQVHYILEKGSQPRPRPLVLLHGWPHNSAAFLAVIEPLARPERFGGRAEDGFDVIVPSYPGAGLSGSRPRRSTPRRSLRSSTR